MGEKCGMIIHLVDNLMAQSVGLGYVTFVFSEEFPLGRLEQ